MAHPSIPASSDSAAAAELERRCRQAAADALVAGRFDEADGYYQAAENYRRQADGLAEAVTMVDRLAG